MEFRGAKFLHILKLAVLLVITHFPTHVVTQETNSWTFNIPGVSFISFSPVYTNTQNQHISLNFRTRDPNGLIFCHYLKDLDVKELERINYKLCGELQYGIFVLNYRLMQYSESGLTVGKALNNNQWHALDIFINVTSGELSVTVDKETRVASLKAYTRQSYASLLDWTTHSSAVYFGGTDPDTLFSDIYPHLLGCMSNIRYLNKENKLVPIPVAMMEGVVKGCVDTCETNPCHHGGQCINGYSEAICDCFGTDYQGDVCSELGPTSVTLRGYEWFTYSMHPYDEKILTETMRLSLEFKTSRGSGVLFYAVGGAPYHNHVTASVHAGKVQVSMAFGDENIEVQAGIGIDDYRWHNLTIVHNVNKVYVYLDGRQHGRDILDNINHLALDPKIYIGGGENFIETRGLQVTQNFVGCLKNIYINEKSVLYEMSRNNPLVVYNGGASTQTYYACKEVVNIPISFPTSAAMLKLDSTEDMKTSFEIEFDFKTVRSEAIVLYVSLQETDKREYNFGYIEVWIKQGKPQLIYVPSKFHPDRSQNYSIPNVVNTNTWRSLQLSVKQGEAKLMVNGNSVSTVNNGRILEIHSKIVVGYGFNVYKDSEGFVGCIRNLKVQGMVKDAIEISQSKAASGLIIDGCNITDYCAGNRMCEHGGVCLSEWTAVACDCTETHYTGHACHFSKYKQTCDEYYQAGVTKTGVMLIDLDGSGPLDPLHAKCEMGYEEDFMFFGRTVVEHNLAPNTTVRKSMMQDLRKYVSYRELERTELIKLTTESAWCEQYIRYDCQHSPLRLGLKTWFKAANGEMVEYLGTDDKQPGHCTCSLSTSCDRCNCDNQTMSVDFDEGYNKVNSQLPITEITVKQDDDPLNPGSGNFTLGPLVCWGNKNQLPTNAVTFASDSGYLLSQAWKSGAIRVSFRTHHSSAIVLYQNGTAENINYFIVAVTSNTTVKFYFRWGLKKLEVDIVSPIPVNNGQWHQVAIETDKFNVRCMLDMTEKILRIPEDVPTITLFSGVLYIGGVPDTMLKDPVVEDIEGIVGCMRGLAYNDRSYSLAELIDSSTTDVIKECRASCWPNPCHNGAKCVEKWGQHQCICVNKWAHSGHNCEKDINADAVTFLGQPDSYLHFTKLIDSQLLEKTIVFNFRTFKPNTLLFYMHDHLNNFIQVELIDGNKVTAKFNRFNQILDQTRQMAVPLDDGQWNQVVIDNDEGYMKVIVNVDDEPSRNSYKKLSIETYTQTPFETEELVKPIRPDKAPVALIHVYIGGVPSYMSTYNTLYGCIRGLKIGSTVFELQKSAQLTTAVSPVCVDGCETSPCKNGGLCEEQWQNAQYTCDCRSSEYAGPTCNTEASGHFKGSSILQYKYDPPKDAIETRSERLELIFQVNEGIKENMVLIFIYSDRYWTHDFIIVYLDPDHGVYLNTNQGYAIHGVGKEGLFADGKPHRLLYQRSKGEMILTLDEEGIGRVTVPDNALDELDMIMIGGILHSQIAEIPDTSDYKNYLNFTGCMSEVKFYPVGDQPFVLRPLKDLRDSENTTGFVTVYGPEIPGCSTHDGMPTTTTTTPTPPSTSTDVHSFTFPPWNPGPAETEYIGEAPTLPGYNKTSPLITKQTTPISSVVMQTEIILESHDKDKHDHKILAIALCTVAFLLLTAIIVAIILIRIRRRERETEKEVKEKQQEFELKQPLDNGDIDIDGAMISENRQNQNYLARLDEFSTVSATLGARPPKTDGTSSFKPPSESSYSYSSVPQSDDGPTYNEQRFYNRNKNRPASSISEVLEEMERQRSSKDAGPDDMTIQNISESTPLSCTSEGAIMSAIPEHHDDDEENDADNESDSPTPPPPAHILNEYNGDSGYEAESKPDEEETLMIDSYHGEGSNIGEDSLHKILSYDTDTDTSLPPSTPESKNSNYVSENVSPVSHNLDNMSPGKGSPTGDDCKVINYGFPNTPVIGFGPELKQNKPNVVLNGGNDT